MCAIAGILGLAVTDTETLLETMRRRGPDDRGKYEEDGCCLLHSRLAIIDPDGGKQPMLYKQGNKTFVLVYNGELYNTEELRRELLSLGHIFEGHSDTEVVLHSYVQWGDECVHRLNGIFAFAVWEKKSKKTVSGQRPNRRKAAFLYASSRRAAVCLRNEDDPCISLRYAGTGCTGGGAADHAGTGETAGERCFP